MAATAQRSGAAPWAPERIAGLYERSLAQWEAAFAACGTARRQREEAIGRRSRAHERAQTRILPMWKARKACYDRYGPITAMWTAGSARDPGAASAGVPFDEIVGGLFEVSLAVASCRSELTAGTAKRLDEALTGLDGLIRKVRLAAFEDLGRRRLPSGSGSGYPAQAAAIDQPAPADDDLQRLVARLEDVAAQLSGLADAETTGSRALHLREAAQCATRALGLLGED